MNSLEEIHFQQGGPKPEGTATTAPSTIRRADGQNINVSLKNMNENNNSPTEIENTELDPLSNGSAGAVSAPDLARLKSLEAVIKCGQQTFVEVGDALAQIMEGQLYRLSGFGSFAEYCESVWGFKKSYAYQLVQSAAVVNELPAPLSTMVEKFNPGQVRALARVSKDKRAAVLTTAMAKSKSTGRTLTAKAITAAAHPEIVTTAVVAIKVKSIECQLRELWEQATPAERDQFLEWIKPQPAETTPPPFRCDSCDNQFEDDDDGVSLYECDECGTKFTRETSLNNNHQCADCNKFGRKVSDHGCPDCNEGELINQNTKDTSSDTELEMIETGQPPDEQVQD